MVSLRSKRVPSDLPADRGEELRGRTFELTLLEAPVISTADDIWRDYLPNPYSWANSLLIHLLAVSALLVPFVIKGIIHPPSLPHGPINFIPIQLTLPPLHGHADETHGGGGGGVSMPRPASRGALPEFARTQFTPPAVELPKTPPLLSMAPTLLGPPELKLPEMKLNMPWGDPHGVLGQLSGGPGTGGGIGTGNGTGDGPGQGPGYGPGRNGGYGGDTYQPGIGGVTEPVAIYSPPPAYSEEARKAKYQGTVLLWIVVTAQGLVENIRVAKPLGMGLDEEAKKTVATWRFKPAIRQGLPVPVQMEVEVTFHLF